ARHQYILPLERLQDLFKEMDHAYQTVAEQYGFHCSGCMDSCCQTRFYHHTLLELLYLAVGWRTFESRLRLTVHARALAVNEQMTEADRRGAAVPILCPLNRDGLCLGYAYRPMICRLHGIPHELHRPGRQVTVSPGCDTFFSRCRESGTTGYIRFDRTPFYRQMSLLETDLRRRTGYTDKIKFTVAQMLATMTEDVDEID
ncbi:MAG: hypothetical protein WBY88_14965, partial [Desulfosarcina sp.]